DTTKQLNLACEDSNPVYKEMLAHETVITNLSMTKMACLENLNTLLTSFHKEPYEIYYLISSKSIIYLLIISAVTIFYISFMFTIIKKNKWKVWVKHGQIAFLVAAIITQILFTYAVSDGFVSNEKLMPQLSIMTIVFSCVPAAAVFLIVCFISFSFNRKKANIENQKNIKK
ncbi:hypothetical protein JXB28_04450, partial [Candidatus Woesearchaeota archaeon]|nr:hypothetical protein [Candidatus Woesearchaeota archaeon]